MVYSLPLIGHRRSGKMSNIKFFAVTTLPSTLAADAFYYVANGNYAESYLTDNTGTAKMVGNSTMINNIVAQELANWSGSASQVTIVANIAERDALAETAESNLMVVVIDATDDPTVTVGSALYAYALASETWYKLSEYESMDIVVQWNQIQGAPSSTPAQIDSAVTQAHTHTNMAQLNKIGESETGDMTYNGQPVKTQWDTKNW